VLRALDAGVKNRLCCHLLVAQRINDAKIGKQTLIGCDAVPGAEKRRLNRNCMSPVNLIAV
jgi:hypothetical protein